MNRPEFIRRWCVRDLLMLAGSVLSGVLLAVSFAPQEWADTAWCALIPLLIVCSYATPREAIRYGWQAGFVFWLVSMVWLTRVTVFGWLLLSAYCAVYVVPLALIASWWFQRYGVSRFRYNIPLMFVLTATWVASEYTRFNLLTGFPWNPLGASQYANLAFIQHASWGSVYGIGAMLVLVNAAVAITVIRYLRKHARLGRTHHPEMMIAISVVLIAFVTGGTMHRSVSEQGTDLRIALIQPGIPQEEKWTAESEEMIYTRLTELTSNAILWTKPDLVVWPETALPYDVRLSEVWYGLVDSLARMGAPILVGSMDSETLADRKPRYYNSSFLFDTNGVIIEEYDKCHLVLFGEYVPFHEVVDIVNAMTPVMESFSPGKTNTVFRVPLVGSPFSSLICFEDTMPYLARRSVRNGARLLINQTNDAWFDPSAASRQHMILSVFRTVENRVPMVRSANTGYSCHIRATGEIREVLAGESGRHDGPGFQLVTVRVPPEDLPPTFYTRFGDVFAWACLALSLPFLVIAVRSVKPTPSGVAP